MGASPAADANHRRRGLLHLDVVLGGACVEESGQHPPPEEHFTRPEHDGLTGGEKLFFYL